MFLASAMKTLAIGGTTRRNAWGRITWVIVRLKGMPTARAASACPTGTPLMPERSASHTKAAV